MENNGDCRGEAQAKQAAVWLAGSQKQQSICEPCFAYIRALEIHALGVNRREGQNIYDGNYYCVGWAERINPFLLLLSVAVGASPNWFQEGSLALCPSPLLPSTCLLTTRKELAQATLPVRESW